MVMPLLKVWPMYAWPRWTMTCTPSLFPPWSEWPTNRMLGDATELDRG